MILSIGPLLSEISVSEASPVARFFPWVLLLLGMLIVVAVCLGLKHLGRGKGEDEERSDE